MHLYMRVCMTVCSKRMVPLHHPCPTIPFTHSFSDTNVQVRIWHATTYRAETTLNYGMERVWALAASKDSNKCVPWHACLCLCMCVWMRVGVVSTTG